LGDTGGHVEIRFVVVIVGLAMVAVGCGNAAENVLEGAIVSQLEEEGGGDADIDLAEDDRSVSIETDEGSIEIGGGEIPDDFLLPIPDHLEVQMVSSQTGDYAGATVALTFDGDDFQAEIALYEDYFAVEGWEFCRTDTTNGNETVVFIFAQTSDLGASVTTRMATHGQPQRSVRLQLGRRRSGRGHSSRSDRRFEVRRSRNDPAWSACLATRLMKASRMPMPTMMNTTVKTFVPGRVGERSP
jgi:hypothetical protein